MSGSVDFSLARACVLPTYRVQSSVLSDESKSDRVWSSLIAQVLVCLFFVFFFLQRQSRHNRPS